MNMPKIFNVEKKIIIKIGAITKLIYLAILSIVSIEY